MKKCEAITLGSKIALQTQTNDELISWFLNSDSIGVSYKASWLVNVQELDGRLGALDPYGVATVDFPKCNVIDRFQVAIVDAIYYEK